MGNITDRKELFEWYNQAKVFCLTSRFEGFPITFAEALYFGNFIISTPVSSALQITNNSEFGKVVKAVAKDFSAAIKEVITEGFLTSKQYENALKFSNSNFSWPGIVKKLADKLKKDA
jgi:glycosyltransferase involved in cell wall biosynthesis